MILRETKGQQGVTGGGDVFCGPFPAKGQLPVCPGEAAVPPQGVSPGAHQAMQKPHQSNLDWIQTPVNYFELISEITD